MNVQPIQSAKAWLTLRVRRSELAQIKKYRHGKDYTYREFHHLRGADARSWFGSDKRDWVLPILGCSHVFRNKTYKTITDNLNNNLEDSL